MRLLAAIALWTLAATFSSVAFAVTEEVVVEWADADQAIVVRQNGERHLIEKGIGCMSLEFRVGRRVIVTSPGLYLGIGTQIIVPERNQQCRVWNAQSLSGPIDAQSPQPTRPPAVGADHERRCISSRVWEVSTDGEIVQLLDGSIWEIDAVGQIHSMLWLPTQEVLVCENRLIHVARGRTVRAQRLR